jgi:hypothetical protein
VASSASLCWYCFCIRAKLLLSSLVLAVFAEDEAA